MYTISVYINIKKDTSKRGDELKNQLDNPSLKRISAKDYAYFQIKEKIIEGKLHPDQSVIEEELSSKLEISRTPLREALQRLEFENMVVRQTNGRLKIAPISVQEVKEIFNVRAKLEGIAVVEATQNATEKDIRALSNIAYMIKKTYSDGNIEDILYYGAQFHSYIYDLSGNKTVNNMLSQLNDHIHRYRRLVPHQSIERVIEAGDEHQHILDRIAANDPKGAEIEIQQHIKNSLDSAITAIKEYEKKLNRSIW